MTAGVAMMPTPTYPIVQSSYPQVRVDHQVHLRSDGQESHGVLACATTGAESWIASQLAKALRMMTGVRSFAELAGEFARDHAMDRDDALTALIAVADQFVAERVVEISDHQLPARSFPPPLCSAFRLRILQLQLTNRCNLTCVHCYAESGRALPRQLTRDEKIALLDQFAALGGTRLFLTGGESLLDPDLDDLITQAKQLHLFVYLSTNGYAISKRSAARLVELGVGAVNVSIDGSDAQTHDTFRGRPGAYRHAVNALRAFAELGIACASQTTLFKGNLDQSNAIADQMRAIGVKDCFFVRMSPQGRAADHTDLIPDLAAYAAARESEYRHRKQRYAADVRLKPSNSSRRCSAGVSQLYVRADGACFPCPSLAVPDLALGTFLQQTLADIWTTRAQTVAELRAFDPLSIASCQGCRHLPSCHGGCAGNALMHTGDWRQADPHFCITMDIRERVSQET
jgi:radical SAM protein with 4Fe4S-binding SPASM domain